MRVFGTASQVNPPAPEDRVIQAELPTRSLEPGTPMVKVVPPRLVEPYLTGQRSVIAGYVYRASDCSFLTPADYYQSLALGYEGSEFSANMPELFVLRWVVLDMSASLVAGPRAVSAGPGPSPACFSRTAVPGCTSPLSARTPPSPPAWGTGRWTGESSSSSPPATRSAG